MNIRITCTCGAGSRRDTDRDRARLRDLGGDAYGYGDLVSDPRAFSMRLFKFSGWRYTDGEIGRTVVAMTCPKCLVRRHAEDAG